MTVLSTWLIRIFSILWALFLLLDYASASEYLTSAFSFFEYNGMLATISIMAAIVVWLFTKRPRKGLTLTIHHYRNIYAYPAVLLLMMIIMGFYLSVSGLKTGEGGSVLIFLFKTIGFHLAVLPVLAAAFGAGHFVFRFIPLQMSESVSWLIRLVLGFAVLTLFLFLLGAMKLLHAWIVFPLLAVMIWPGAKELMRLVKEHLISVSKSFEIHAAALLPWLFTLLMIAVNFCFITRPFPVGFDELNLYMNTPKLMAGYHGLTQGGDAYNWSVVMSLGFILYDKLVVATLLSVLPGILTLLVIYRMARMIHVSREWSITACALYYTLPNIIWQSRNDAKVDLALMFVTLCAVLLLMEFYFGNRKNQEKISLFGKQLPSLYLVWSLAGFMLGFAFGIKYTSVMCVFGFLVYLFYMTGGKWAAAGMFFLNFAIIFGLRLTRFGAFEAESPLLGIFPMVLAAGCFAMSARSHFRQLTQSVVLAAIFGVSMALTFIPWAAKNVTENGSVSFSHILTGKSPAPVLYPEMSKGVSESTKLQNNQPAPVMAGVDLLPGAGRLLAEATTASPDSVKAGGTDKYEEIRRYLGYESGVIRFISLPYDLAMKTNVKLWSADTGILFLILLPVLMIAAGGGLLPNVLRMIAAVLFLIVSVISVNSFKAPFSLQQAIDSLQATAFTGAPAFEFLAPLLISMKKIVLNAGELLLPIYHYLTVQTLGFSFMLVMLSSVLFFLLFRNFWSSSDTNVRSLMALTFTILITWMILASGIFWYGMAGFALLALLTGLFANKAAVADYKFNTIFIGSVIACWFILILPFQFMPMRFTMAAKDPQGNYRGFIDAPFGRYALGAASEKEVFRQFFQPAEQSIINTINNNRNARVLNVATFLTYHINDNDKRVITDNQLGVFEKMYAGVNGDKNALIDEMKRKEIRYVLVSLYTPTLDMTPEQSLRKKYSNLMNALVNNPRATLLFTNRVVERPDGQMPYMVEGRQVRSMYHLAGMRVLNQGSVALFEIP